MAHQDHPAADGRARRLYSEALSPSAVISAVTASSSASSRAFQEVVEDQRQRREKQPGTMSQPDNFEGNRPWLTKLLNPIDDTEAPAASPEFTFICKTCSASVPISAHKSHAAMHDLPRYRCDTCGASFVTGYSLKYHLQAKHPRKEPDQDSQTLTATNNLPKLNYRCAYCDAILKTYVTMRRHLISQHSNEPDFHLHKYLTTQSLPSSVHPCPYCSATYTSYVRLKSHKRSDHRGADTTPGLSLSRHTCTYCGATHATKDDLERHHRTQHRQGEFNLQFQDHTPQPSS